MEIILLSIKVGVKTEKLDVDKISHVCLFNSSKILNKYMFDQMYSKRSYHSDDPQSE